jgi:hypothetical protein
VSSAESTIPQYTVETLVIAVVAGSVAALVVGFATGYLCGRKCHKDDDDNLPYPDTEYEYFEQRQNVNRYTADFENSPRTFQVFHHKYLLMKTNLQLLNSKIKFVAVFAFYWKILIYNFSNRFITNFLSLLYQTHVLYNKL